MVMAAAPAAAAAVAANAAPIAAFGLSAAVGGYMCSPDENDKNKK
jgi:hypothetical protein